MNELSDCTVVIRSHGVGKNIYDSLEERKVNIVDATCPFVKKIHEIVCEESEKGKAIIIVGSEYHPEVEGIKGWVKGDAYIVDDEADVEALNISKETPVCIVSQTTYNAEKFAKETVKRSRHYTEEDWKITFDQFEAMAMDYVDKRNQMDEEDLFRADSARLVFTEAVAKNGGLELALQTKEIFHKICD